MSATQLKAAEILLRKALPDLQAVENTHQGPGGQPIQISNADGDI